MRQLELLKRRRPMPRARIAEFGRLAEDAFRCGRPDAAAIWSEAAFRLAQRARASA